MSGNQWIKYVFAWNNKGVALKNLSRFKDAIECYDKAIEINPQFLTAWENKAFAEEKLGKFSELQESKLRINEIKTKS